LSLNEREYRTICVQKFIALTVNFDLLSACYEC
jgi:hypothetical protein